MSDYVTLQRRIWRELDRDDITADAKDAILTAIKHYGKKRFWFNEQRWEASTTSSTEYYTLPNDLRDLDTLKISINNNQYLLNRRTWEEIENFSISPTTYVGFPTDYALFRNEIRLYPVPNGGYPMTLAGQRDLPDLSSDGSTNDWMTEGEELIRSRASADLVENVLQDYEESRAERYRAREREAFLMLNEETIKRTLTGTVKKRRW